jgi:cell division protein FtsX
MIEYVEEAAVYGALGANVLLILAFILVALYRMSDMSLSRNVKLVAQYIAVILIGSTVIGTCMLLLGILIKESVESLAVVL